MVSFLGATRTSSLLLTLGVNVRRGMPPRVVLRLKSLDKDHVKVHFVLMLSCLVQAPMFRRQRNIHRGNIGVQNVKGNRAVLQPL